MLSNAYIIATCDECGGTQEFEAPEDDSQRHCEERLTKRHGWVCENDHQYCSPDCRDKAEENE